MFKRIAVLSALSLVPLVGLAQSQEIRGTVTDSMCGKQHMMKNATAAQCTRECVKSGANFALAAGDKLYTLKGDKTQIDRFAVANVMVQGDVHGTTIDVKQIKAAK